jgi:molecular chaperone Hsp33
MIKKNIPGMSTKDILKAKAKDKLYSFLLADGKIRGAILNGTHMLKEMRLNHNLGILESFALGESYLASALMSANLKGNDSITFSIEGTGPLDGLSVDSTAFGEVRGYLKTNPIPIDKPLESFDLSPFLGAGFLTVTKRLENAKQPFTGKIEFQYGSIALDLANYFLVSEQTPTAFNLSIKFDKEGKIIGAGGLFLQAMPDADEDTVKQIEDLVANLPSIGQSFADDTKPDDLIHKTFKDFSPKVLANYRVEFMCHCSETRMVDILKSIQKEEMDDMCKNGPFPLRISCHNCNTDYYFTKSELEEINK